MHTISRQLLAGLRLLVVMTVLLGIGYPLVVLGIGQLALPAQANGSLVSTDGTVVGSSLIGQEFSGPQWFQSRPSASDYSGTTSGGSNLSPASDAAAKARADREAQLLKDNPDAVGPIPQDALTASASGLDPHISPAYAAWQAPRVAKARNLPLSAVQGLIATYTTNAPLAFIGEDCVNVVDLNHALSALPK